MSQMPLLGVSAPGSNFNLTEFQVEPLSSVGKGSFVIQCSGCHLAQFWESGCLEQRTNH
jgi:hypothetical protein